MFIFQKNSNWEIKLAIEPIEIYFKGDDLVLRGNVPTSLLYRFKNIKTPRGCQFQPMDYYPILDFLRNSSIPVKTKLPENFPLSNPVSNNFTLRDYQIEALREWRANNSRGTIVLPTGSGKTFVGLAAISDLAIKTLIIVPTIDLLDQWLAKIIETGLYPSENLGKFGGGKREIHEITVVTYDSARIYLKRLRQAFGLLIFDEVHHLSGQQWQDIGRGYLAKCRLGLTATLSKSDNSYNPVINLVGPVVYEKKPNELREIGAISLYELKSIYVKLSTADQQEYTRNITTYKEYMRKKRLFGVQGYQKLIYRYKDPYARKALTAHRKAREIAFNSTGKLTVVRDIINSHPQNKILLFCESIRFIEQVSETLLIPVVTSKTPIRERKALLSCFKNGTIRILASGKVFDEGIDITSASVGIIISGTGQTRQFVQRLGRILRPTSGKSKALLYEIITEGTSEVQTSKRRRIPK